MAVVSLLHSQVSSAEAWTSESYRITNVQVDEYYNYDPVLTFDKKINSGCENGQHGRLNLSVIPAASLDHLLSISLTALTTGKRVMLYYKGCSNTLTDLRGIRLDE